MTYLFAALALSATSMFSDTTIASRDSLEAEIEASLREELLQVWYPRVVDEEYGGFLTTFSHDWQLEGPQDKFIVTQARHVWTASRAAERYPEDHRYMQAARHGFEYLRDYLWDSERGGFFELRSREGELRRDRSGSIVKQAYGNAFGLYALAAYFEVSRDSAALSLAQDAFRWLEAHSHDPVHGGYFQFIGQDGTPMRSGYGHYPPKDQNSSIHLLEALTELYRVWQDSLLAVRLEEMLVLIRDRITTPEGYMQLFFLEDWTPISYRDSSATLREANFELDHVSFGHDVETAFLMLEATEALGQPVGLRTLPIAKKMVDHALAFGWDADAGGLYDRGYYFPSSTEPAIILPTKTWWSQAEALNTFLIMADLFPDDPWDYAAAFRKQWEYVDRYLIDHEYGGWYGGGLDQEPERASMPKAHLWKAAYHDGRALLNVVRRMHHTWTDPLHAH